MSVVETAPRIMCVPDSVSSAGAEAIELAARAGLTLDPWQAQVLDASLAEAPDGRWAAAEVGICVPRQNGKNAILEARELAALFLFDEQLIIHSAQQFKTSKEHFLRLMALIESTPDLVRRVRRVVRAHGEEAIELKDGKRIMFFSRTKSAGRGFTAPLIVFDEAMFLPESSMGALVPTMAAVENRQRWYAGTSVDQFVHNDGIVFARVRERAIRGTDPRLVYFEWSVEADHPRELDDEALHEEANWQAANPGFGIRISGEAIADELRALDRRTFAVERLGVGDWPDPWEDVETAIPLDRWLALVDDTSELVDPVCFAYDVAPDRSSAAIAAAGRRPDGLFHVELVEYRHGTAWVVPALAALCERWNPIAVMADLSGPAGALAHRCEEAAVPVEPVSAGDHAKACGLLVDQVANEGLRHLGDDKVTAALKGATRRPLGDAWAWSRKNSAVDICPLVALTLALWGAETLGWNPADDPVIW